MEIITTIEILGTLFAYVLVSMVGTNLPDLLGFRTTPKRPEKQVGLWLDSAPNSADTTQARA